MFRRIAGVMGYYGITYSATNLSGNVFINYELSMYKIFYFILKFWG